jgi:CRISPR/Cas system endoribonuclease Cas6 (RAMP superfamily)
MPAKKNFHPYAEAQAAVRALSINKQPEYKRRYREDPRLPASPHVTYANTGWTDWYGFLGNKRPEWYATYAEAQAAVRALGIIKQPEYKKRHREDPRLSSTPPKGLCQCRLDGLV